MSATGSSSSWPSPNANGSGVRPQSPASTPRNQPLREYSCVLCKKRKIRCDRANPCSGCVENGVECVSSTRKPYHRKRLHSEKEKNVSTQPLEKQHDSKSGTVDVTRKPVAVVSEANESQLPTFGQNLWTGLNDKVKSKRVIWSSINSAADYLQFKVSKSSVTDEAAQSVACESPLADPTAFIFASSPRDFNLRDSHPLPMYAFMLWNTFQQNINPLSKVIYAPAVQSEVLQASRDFDSITRGTAALLFAVYAAAVTSMKDEECQSTMGEPRKALLARYITATQQALAAAGFMKSMQIVVLQAFTIYLLSARQLYDTQSVYLLTGMAVRIGQRIKLDDDRESVRFSLFENQIRRRVWWQLILIDSRSGQLAGIHAPLQPGTFNFPLPANLNDADIYPDMTEMPVVHTGPTEMIFCLLRYEFGKFLNSNGKKLSSPTFPLAEKDKLIDDLENSLECSFLRYCDPAIPLHLLSVGGARSGICKMRLMAHHPLQFKNASMPQTERDLVLSMSMKMVEYDLLGQSTKAMENFSWHLEVYFQVDAFVFMLIESQNQPTGPIADRVWKLISETYVFRPALLEEESNDLYVAVGELTLRVWDARVAEFVSQYGQSPSVPPFILTLQMRRANKMNGESNSLPGSTNIVPKNALLQPVNEHGMENPEGCITHDLSYNNNGRHIDNNLYYSTTNDIAPLGWESMDWDYWSNLLEGNAAQQTGQNLLE